MLNLFFGSTMLYIDPAATSMLISSITAIAVAVGASLIIFWRRVRKKMHIKTKDNREVEEDIVVIDNSLQVEEEKSDAKVEQTEEN